MVSCVIAPFYLYTPVHVATMQGKVERVVSTCTNQNKDFPTRQYVKWVFGHFACAWLDSRLLEEHGSKGLQVDDDKCLKLEYVLK